MSDAATDMEQDAEDRAEAEGAIAEQIVALSQATETPTEFEPTGRTFDLDDVDFSSPTWITCLADVQGWLRLPQELSLDDENQFLGTLAQGLEFEELDDAIESANGRPRLTALALDRLNARLQRAVQLQEAFDADSETDGSSRASATSRWIDAWDEVIDEEEGTEPVSAKATTWPINEFSDRASRNKLNLSPSYQRGDVWPTSDAQMLIESILRGIPLPSVIILKPEGAGAPYEVVDGKQRLTTILRFIGKHPLAVARIREAEASTGKEFRFLFETNYPAFRKKWKNVVGEDLSSAREREYYFPFKLRSGSNALKGELAALRGKYYTQIKEARVRIADEEMEVSDLFERVTEYKIPLIEYSKATRVQIHEVFNLYNKQGKHLNAEEIRNALYHDVKFMRGLLVASGDNSDVAAVAPFLAPEWDELSQIGDILFRYGVGTARYRRTKVLSWLASMLLFDSRDSAGVAKRLSTASHINGFLARIEGDARDPLRNDAKIRDAFGLLLEGMFSHSAIKDAWAPQFRDTKTGAKWQELQLIASLLGVTIAAASLGDDTADVLESIAPELREKTGSSAWKRPPKTQTASQWEYIARIATEIVDVLGVDLEQASARLVERFGYSCVPTLRSALAGSGPE
jgi:hypothetical protein